MLSISVVIPAYNAAAWIRETIASVQAQSHPATEILVVNNNSTDATVALATEAGATVLHETQVGAAAARNAGIRAARGEWIALLDADDYWLPEKLAHHAALVAVRPDLRLSTTNYFFDQGGVRSTASAYDKIRPLYDALPKTRLTPDASYVTIPDLAAQLGQGNQWIGLNSSAVVLRREDALAIGGFDVNVRQVEDMEFYARLLRMVEGVAFVEVPLVAYRLHGSNGTLNLMALAEWHVKMREMMLAHPTRYLTHTDTWARATLPRWYRQVALAHLRAGSGKAARQAAAQSWRLKPNWRTPLLWLGGWLRP